MHGPWLRQGLKILILLGQISIRERRPVSVRHKDVLRQALEAAQVRADESLLNDPLDLAPAIMAADVA